GDLSRASQPERVRKADDPLRRPQSARSAVSPRTGGMGQETEHAGSDHRRLRWRELAGTRRGSDVALQIPAPATGTDDGYGLRAGDHDAVRGTRPAREGRGRARSVSLDGTQHEMRGGILRPLSVGAAFPLQGRANLRLRENRAPAGSI